MRYMLNGQFEFQGEKYWRVDDLDRMIQEEKDGAYDAIASMRRFGIAINAHNVSHEQAQKMVRVVNEVLKGS